jgi:hypothetical protein
MRRAGQQATVMGPESPPGSAPKPQLWAGGLIVRLMQSDPERDSQAKIAGNQ